MAKTTTEATTKTVAKKSTAKDKVLKAVKGGVKAVKDTVKKAAPKKSAVTKAAKAKIAAAESEAPKAKIGRKEPGEY